MKNNPKLSAVKLAAEIVILFLVLADHHENLNITHLMLM